MEAKHIERGVAICLSGIVCWLTGTVGLAQSAPSWDELTAAGQKAMRANNLPGAEKYFRDALKESEKFQPSDPRTAESLDNVANVLKTQRKFGESEKYYEQVLQLRKKYLHSGDRLITYGLLNLIAVYNADHKYDQARKLYDEERTNAATVRIVKCQLCESSEHLVPVFYGTVTPQIKALAAQGKLKIGGTVRPKDRAEWYCTACDAVLDREGHKFTDNKGDHHK